ncbi:MAG: Mov34/MPN/PAD-1 family protein [Candidatus Heimdallarchaeaceae archaeon]
MSESNSNEILISATAIAKILAIDKLDTSKESAGLLLGYIDKDSDILVITDIDTGKQQQTSTYVVIDDEALVEMVISLQEKGGKETIIGWWHTHPGYGCFLSGTDKNTQRTYQNLFPQAVALVVDPLKYYNSQQQSDLEIQFFRLIDQFDYKPIQFGIFFDEIAHHINNLAHTDVEWIIPQLPAEQVEELHKKLESIYSPFLLDKDKKMLHGFIDILSATEERRSVAGPQNEILRDIDTKLSLIGSDVKRIYQDETFKLYSMLNLLAAIIIVVAWFLFVFLS